LRIFRSKLRIMADEETEFKGIDGGENAAAAYAAAAAEAAEVSAEQPAAVEVAGVEGMGERDQLRAERDQLLDRVARLQAEFENARKRAEREKAEYREYAVGAVIEKFLPVLDNFELALKATGSAEQLRQGVELIVKQMEGVLEQFGVRAVEAVGAEFDPRLHEALGTVERDDMPDHHVAEEIRRGYRHKERLLRPSLVRVASNPKQIAE
jgi:molecular chaperone GrpE